MVFWKVTLKLKINIEYIVNIKKINLKKTVYTSNVKKNFLFSRD
jgi:hypothetical protein